MPRFPHVSDTTSTIIVRAFGSLQDRISSRLQHEDKVLHPLHVGDTWLEPFPAAMAEAQHTSAQAGLHKYPPPQGMPELIDAIVARIGRLTGVQRTSDQVQVMSGATVGLGCVVRAVVDAGDEVLLPAPFWPLIRGIIASRGATPVQVPFWDRLGDPTFDVEAALEAAVTERTVAIYINSPHNPTGAVLAGEQAAAVARVATRHGLWLFTDEVYEDIWFTAERPTPFWTRPDVIDRAIVTHSMSKAFGLAGARVGYTHGPADVMRIVRGVQLFTVYSAAKPMQLGAAAALRDGQTWQDDCRRRYDAQRKLTAEALGLPAPAGGTFLFFDVSRWLPDGATDALPFMERCLDEGVLLCPGSACGADYGTSVRLCFTSVGPEALEDALNRLCRVMR